MMNIRELQKEDYYKNYLQLLSQLTTVGYISYQDFIRQFDQLNSHIYVIENDNKIIASGTILIEYKFIHNNGIVGHIEDIIVDKNFHGLGLGRKLINHLIGVAKKNNCYKVILNCNKNVIDFYHKLGFTNKKNNFSLSTYITN